jgi:hypothetical protein
MGGKTSEGERLLSASGKGIYSARLRNARIVGERIQALLDQGYLIFDDERQPIQRVYFEGFSGAPEGLSFSHTDSHCRMVYMHPDPEFDNGLHTSIGAFRNLFSAWQILHPSSLVSLF